MSCKFTLVLSSLREIVRFIIVISSCLLLSSCSFGHSIKTGELLSEYDVCVEVLDGCIPLNTVVKKKKQKVFRSLKGDQKLVSFEYEIDLSKLKLFALKKQLNKPQKRFLLQQLAIKLNNISVKNFKQSSPFFLENVIEKVDYIAINNSAVFHLEINKNLKEKHGHKQKILSRNIFKKSVKKRISSLLRPSKNDMVIALIGSGISTNHQQLNDMDIRQFNPENNSNEVIDTGLGHGTGIISLFAAAPKKGKVLGLLPQAKYLSCNGLPQGNYRYVLVLRCMNWLFLEEKVDVIVNAWLVSRPGCMRDLEYPLQVLWEANTIPIFSVGNYGEELNQNYSPANLTPFHPSVPLISVGALDSENRRLRSSSYGISLCGSQRTLPTIMADGEEILVAVPFTRTSYLRATGTSYAVAYVGAAVASLMQKFKGVSNEQIVNVLLSSSDDLGKKGVDKEFGFGKLNFHRAVRKLNSFSVSDHFTSPD